MLVNQLGNNQPTVPSRYAIAQDAVAVKEIKRAANDADPYRIGEPVRNNFDPGHACPTGENDFTKSIDADPYRIHFSAGTAVPDP